MHLAMMRFMLTIIQQIILVAAATVPTIILIIPDIQALGITMTKIESGGCFGRKSSLRASEDFWQPDRLELHNGKQSVVR